MIEGALEVPFFYGKFLLHIYICFLIVFPMLDFRLAPFYFAELPKF